MWDTVWYFHNTLDFHCVIKGGISAKQGGSWAPGVTLKQRFHYLYFDSHELHVYANYDLLCLIPPRIVQFGR